MSQCENCNEVLSSYPTDDPSTEAVEVQYREAGIAVSDYYCNVECLVRDHERVVEQVYGDTL